MYIVYILFSEQLNRYYIGFTGGRIEVRLAKHLASRKGFTAKVKDWYVCYTETFTTKPEAMQREKQIKNWKNQQRITELIQRSSIE